MYQDNKLGISKDSIKDQCFELEFGYYNVNTGSIREKNYIDAWHITIKGKRYVYMLLPNSGNMRIHYDNGVRY